VDFLFILLISYFPRNSLQSCFKKPVYEVLTSEFPTDFNRSGVLFQVSQSKCMSENFNCF